MMRSISKELANMLQVQSIQEITPQLEKLIMTSPTSDMTVF
jgi:hypothetical protein